MAEVLPDALIQHCRKPGDPGLNPMGRQGSRALRKWRREFKAELDVVSNEPCPLHHHDPEITRAECFAVSLWTLAQSGERWACNLLLNRWLGRTPLTVDLQQRIAVDLTQAFDERALARYRWLVQHEHELTSTSNSNCSTTACAPVPRNFHPLEATMVDYNRWSDADLHRYRQLLTRAVDAQVLPECALTDDELRELERYRLGLVEHIDAVPVPVHDEHFPITERAVVEHDSHASNITTLVPRTETEASDIEPKSPALPPAAPRTKRPPAPSLTPEDLDGCGIYEINGIPSTIFGDHRAEQILSGEIPIEQAKREEQARRRTNMGRPGIVSPYL